MNERVTNFENEKKLKVYIIKHQMTPSSLRSENLQQTKPVIILFMNTDQEI